MKCKIIYIGLDVDDTQYHGAALDKDTGELINFTCRPTLKGLLGQLDKLSTITQGARSACVMKQPISAIPCKGI